MPEAKAKPKESWIRGKQIKTINRLNEKVRINSQARSLINKEISYISSFFPNFNISGLYNPGQIFIHAILLFYQPDPGLRKTMDSRFKKRLINLLAGIELLAIGTTLHDFYIDLIKTGKGAKSSPEEELEEKNYTLKLLFGDIFYSRAVIYLLKFNNHQIFDRILKSLKVVHNSKLAFHGIVREQENKDYSNPANFSSGNFSSINFNSTHFDHVNFEKCKMVVSGINALFKISFEIGQEIFKPGSRFESEETEDILNQIINELTLLKSYINIEKFLKYSFSSYQANQFLEYASDKKNFIKNKLNDMISESRLPHLFGEEIRELIFYL